MTRSEDLFYIFVLLTVLIIRISVFLVPDIDINIFGFILHHFYIGLFFLAIGLIVYSKKSYLKIPFLGIGFGFVIDEFLFILLGAGNDADYWSFLSLMGTFVGLLVTYPLRKKLRQFLKF